MLTERREKSGSLGSIFNAGINVFVKNATIELKNEVRINVVSPGLVIETTDLMESSEELIKKDFLII